MGKRDEDPPRLGVSGRGRLKNEQMRRHQDAIILDADIGHRAAFVYGHGRCSFILDPPFGIRTGDGRLLIVYGVRHALGLLLGGVILALKHMSVIVTIHGTIHNDITKRRAYQVPWRMCHHFTTYTPYGCYLNSKKPSSVRGGLSRGGGARGFVFARSAANAISRDFLSLCCRTVTVGSLTEALL